MYLDDIPTDGPGGIEWIEEINPNLHDARDIEIGKELAWSHRWKVRLPGLKRYGDRIMVMKVVRQAQTVRSKYETSLILCSSEMI